ncbi:MAG: carboxypeptidase-like regulatory domain-containing protein [Ignavibacteria bacterium]|nr:carboxypeptidase-like regulatory domain-containing protein [Ignavibacteria bacterium]
MQSKINQIKKSKFMFLIVFLITLSFQVSFSQGKGSIVGIVRDETSGEPIIGANVIIENTFLGAATDINGKFLIRDVNEGNYSIKVSHIAYQPKILTDVIVKANEITELKITLSNKVIETKEIVVTGKLDQSYENALLNLKKNSQNILDGVSAEQIKKTTDGLTSDVLKRITGITVIENKFVNIRGTNERYNVTQLNNSNLTSTESEKKAFSFDLVSANLIENANVIKSYTPDLPANFGGGIVRLNTVSFPDDLKISIGYSTTYSENTSLRSFYTYKNGTNFLGFDNGSRALPLDFPSDLSKSGMNRDEINLLAKRLNNVWSPEIKKAPLNQSFSFTIGDGSKLIGQDFGFIIALSYKNDFKNSNIELYEYEASGEKRFEYSGRRSFINKNLGGLLNLSYKLAPNHQLSLRNLYSHTSDDEVTQLHGFQYTDAGKEQKQTSLRYIERDLVSSQLTGEHFIPEILSSKIEWRIYLSNSTKKEPDYRRVIYGRDIGTDDPFAAILGFQPNLKNGGRFYSNLFDRGRGFSIDLKSRVDFVQFKYGLSYDIVRRNFASRLISVIINASGNGYTDFNLLYLPIDKIFDAENFRRNGFSIDEYVNGTNNYSASEKIFAGYFMSEIPLKLFNRDLHFIGGIRMENALQTINSMDISGKIPISNSLKKVDFLPSLNMIYKLNEITNLRLSYSQTLNRPELRELAPFAYFDFTTQTSLRGNPNLQRSFIKNYDLRVEAFPGLGKLISASLFYKKISDAIEKVVVTGSALGSERTFMNSDNALVYGYELELKTTFGFISNYLDNLSINFNYSRIKSEVTVKGTQTTIARERRPLQGQSPYVMNIGLFFVEPNLGSSISLTYNRIGERIVEVATSYVEDIVEMPRDVVDLKITQNLFSGVSLNFSIKDLFAQDYTFKQGNLIARKIKSNSSYSVGINYKLN